jgi:hypothetical protein
MLQSLSLLSKDCEIQVNDIYGFTGNPTPDSINYYLNVLQNCPMNEALQTLELQFK